MFLVLAVAAGFGAVAVPLAMLGWFRPFILFPVVLAVPAGFVWWVRTPPIRVTAGSGATWSAVAVIGVVSAMGLAHPTQHFEGNRDPGIYAITGRWLEREGSILVDTAGEEIDDIQNLRSRGTGFGGERTDGKLYPRFSHLTHTYLGAAAQLGGPPLLVRAGVVAGAMALLMLFVLIQQFARGWPAAIATSVVAVSLPQVYFSRGPYSEPLTQLYLLGGLALLAGDRRPRPSVAVLAGLALGGAVASRIDGILVLGGVAAALVAWRIQGRSGPSAGRAWWGFLAGLASVTAIGVADLRLFSPLYLDYQWGSYRRAMLLVGGVTATGLVVLAGHARWPQVGRMLDRRRRMLAPIGALAVVGVLFGAWLLRPTISVQTGKSIDLTAAIQAREGSEVDPTRTYGEQSLRRIGWYVGVPMLIAGIAGAGIVAGRALRGRGRRAVGPVLVLAVPSLVYLWNPSITPDQIWAMRRFVPAALPLVAVLAAIGLDALVDSWKRWRSNPGRRVPGSAGWVGRAGMALVGVVALLPALVVTGPFWQHREHRLSSHELDRFCTVLDGRAVVVDGASGAAGPMTTAIGVWCEVPAASFIDDPTIRQQVLGDLIARSEAIGRPVVLLTTDDGLAADHDDLRWVGSVSVHRREIERTLAAPPAELEPRRNESVTYHLYAVDGSASMDGF